jgi:lipid II isoglutaminyl synthase (glutamine-hydrolysing)
VPDLIIVHLYADLLRTYGDRGNVLALARRAEWRRFSVRVDEVSVGQPLPRGPGLILIGGGTDRVQGAISTDLLARRSQLLEATRAGAVLVGICGGYQLLGRRYVTADGTPLEGLGLLDIETTGSSGGHRIIGRVRARASLWGRGFELVGFENHGGRTSLGPDALPLARVRKGRGNNGVDRGEGAVQGSVVGTYLHGPVLPSNPRLADSLLGRALAARIGESRLEGLDDELEDRAHADARSLRR